MRKIILLLLLTLTLPWALYGEPKENFHISSAQTTPKALKFIGEYYVDQNRIDPYEMLKGALDEIQKNTAEILITFEHGNAFTITIDKAVKRFTPKKLKTLSDLWDVLQEVYTFIEVHYHGTTKLQDIEYMAIDGMLNRLDPHSNILTPKVYNEFMIGTKGKFGGIGIVIGIKEGQLTVISPIEGTPAWNAGIQAKDKIVQIGEESTINMDLTEAVELLRGDPGTDVTVTVEREGRPAPFNVALKRAIINIESVQSQAINIEDRTIGYIKIKNFQTDTDKEFTKQLNKLKESKNFSGLIIDLRNNPGGLLDQSVAIADKFISDGIIVSTIGAGNKFLDQEAAKEEGTEPPYPVVVLVNEGSASASEIVSGTLQNFKRALVIGSQTFGKGSVQTINPMPDGSALKLTIAEYLTAGKNSIQTVGVIPDVKMVPVTASKNKVDLIEDEHESEKTLEGHLSQFIDTTRKDSEYKLSYPLPAPPENEDEDEASRREYSKKLDISKDFSVELAAKILARAPADPYGSLSKSAAAVIAEYQKLNDETISGELNKLGVDWSACSVKGKPVLRIDFALEKNGTSVKQADAGDEVNLVLTAKNMGTGEFCRLAGITGSKEHFLKNKEFVFGKLPPQASKRWSIPLKIPKNELTQNLPITIKFHEAGQNQPSEFQAVVPVRGPALPRYAFYFKLGEPVNSKVPTEPIPQGKAVPLVVEVKNIGDGASTNAFAMIKGVDSKGLFIDSGRTKFGRIEPGQTKSATFKFHVEPSISKNTFEIELTIADQDSFVALTRKIEFTIPGGKSEPPGNQWYETPKITLKNANFPIVTNQGRIRIEGTITDEQQVKDYYVFVGEDKVAYSSNPNKATSYPFSVDIPLKNGNNNVTMIARDDLDMASRSSFVVERK